MILRVPCPAPGDCVACTGTQYLLSAQVSWLRQVRVTLVAARHFALLFALLASLITTVLMLKFSNEVASLLLLF